jgi:hypothetical protein
MSDPVSDLLALSNVLPGRCRARDRPVTDTVAARIEKQRQKKNAYKKRALAAEKTLTAAWLAVETCGDRAAIQAIRAVMADSDALVSAGFGVPNPEENP